MTTRRSVGWSGRAGSLVAGMRAVLASDESGGYGCTNWRRHPPRWIVRRGCASSVSCSTHCRAGATGRRPRRSPPSGTGLDSRFRDGGASGYPTRIRSGWVAPATICWSPSTASGIRCGCRRCCGAATRSTHTGRRAIAHRIRTRPGRVAGTVNRHVRRSWTGCRFTVRPRLAG